MTLKQTLKDKILASLRKVDGWKLLVVDPESLAILDSTCRMTEVLNENVVSVEALFKKRIQQPDKVAVYLISSTLTSVQALIQDFSRGAMYRVCEG
jgi:Sec1 family